MESDVELIGGFTIEVLGEPMGKQRPRASNFAGHARIYTPAKTTNYEGRFALAFGDKYGKAEPLAVPCSVEILATFSLKKGDYNSKGMPNKSGLRKLSGEVLPTKKPDCDNVAKAVLDGLNGIAFVDDSQVVRLVVKKRYGVQPSVEVRIQGV